MGKITDYQSMVRSETLSTYRKAAFRATDSFNAFIEVLNNKRVDSRKKQSRENINEKHEDAEQVYAMYRFADREVSCSVKMNSGKDTDIVKSDGSLEGLAGEMRNCQINGETNANGNAVNEIVSITELAALYENVLLNLNKNTSELWKFVYVDPKISKVELAIKKLDESSLIVSIATTGKNRTQLNKILNGLHNRLMSKGWNCKTSKSLPEKENYGLDRNIER